LVAGKKVTAMTSLVIRYNSVFLLFNVFDTTWSNDLLFLLNTFLSKKTITIKVRFTLIIVLPKKRAYRLTTVCSLLIVIRAG